MNKINFEYARDKNRLHIYGKYYYIVSKYFYGSPLQCAILFKNNENDIIEIRGCI